MSHCDTFMHASTYVARAEFAGCPSDYGCSNPENILIMLGENITINATVIYTPGGNCGFRQEIQHVELKYCISSTSNCTQSRLLWSVAVGQERTPTVDSLKVSWSAERDLAYVFTLANASSSDFGLYQVTVKGRHPTTGQSITIQREYLVGKHQSNILFLKISNHLFGLDS